MGFSKQKGASSKAPAEIVDYAERAKLKEKERERKKFEIQDLEARFRTQVEKCAANNKTLKRLLAGKHSKVVERNSQAFLKRYTEMLSQKKCSQLHHLKENPKAKVMWVIKFPNLDLNQPGQFVYDVEGAWCVFAWDDLSDLLKIAIGGEHKLPERTTLAELVKRAMLQCIGAGLKTYSLANPKATFKIWEPLRKMYMSKKQELRKLIESIDEEPGKAKKEKKVKKLKEAAPEPGSRVKKKNKLGRVYAKGQKVGLPDKVKTSKREKTEAEPRKYAKHLRDDNVLKAGEDPGYSAGMAEVFSLIPKTGIKVSEFNKLVKKKKMDHQRTRIYLAKMRRENSVTVH